MGAAAEPPLALFVPGTVCGVLAALAVVIAGSDLRPSEYPNAKNSAQIPTRPKNRTSILPVPSVISVSCDDAIVQLPDDFASLLGVIPNPAQLSRVRDLAWEHDAPQIHAKSFPSPENRLRSA